MPGTNVFLCGRSTSALYFLQKKYLRVRQVCYCSSPPNKVFMTGPRVISIVGALWHFEMCSTAGYKSDVAALYRAGEMWTLYDWMEISTSSSKCVGMSCQPGLSYKETIKR